MYPNSPEFLNYLLKKAAKSNQRAANKGVEGTVTGEELLDKYIAQQGQCAYCGEPMTAENRTIEHLVAMGQGGTNYISNVVWACQPCNHERADKDNAAIQEEVKRQERAKMKDGIKNLERSLRFALKTMSETSETVRDLRDHIFRLTRKLRFSM